MCPSPENTKLLPNVGFLLAHRLRRSPNINPASGRGFGLAGSWAGVSSPILTPPGLILHYRAVISVGGGGRVDQ